jgi:molybdopterin converting factor small subunit
MRGLPSVGHGAVAGSYEVHPGSLMPLVTFLGDVRRAAGRATVEIDADTVAALLSGIERAVGPEFAAVLWSEEGLQPDVEVLVNGRNVEFLAGLNTRLGPTDQVTIFHSGVRGFPGG